MCGCLRVDFSLVMSSRLVVLCSIKNSTLHHALRYYFLLLSLVFLI